MKIFLNIAIAMCMIGSMVAQETPISKKNNSHKKAQLSPEQQATLRTKQLDLRLDLNTAQEKKIHQLLLDNAKKRVAHKTTKKQGEKKQLTPEERYQRKLKKLDHQLAHQSAMKTILDDKQYEQWKQHSARKHGKKKRHQHKAKSAGR